MMRLVKWRTIAWVSTTAIIASIAWLMLTPKQFKSGTIRLGEYWVNDGYLFFQIWGDPDGIPVRVPTNADQFGAMKFPYGYRKISVAFRVLSLSDPDGPEVIIVPSADDFRMVDLLGKNEYVVIRVPLTKDDPEATKFDVYYSVSEEFSKRFSTWSGTITIAEGIQIRE